MLAKLYSLVSRAPLAVVLVVLGVTVFFAMQLGNLRWETDARVYMPKGHEAIVYDEKVEALFGAKDSLIIGIVNEDEGIFNKETLARIARVTEKVAALDGVLANRLIDVASLSTVSLFVGSETAIGAQRLMPAVPTTPEEIEALKQAVFANADLLVGNMVSADGKAAMIRAKLKEGNDSRYQTYWQIKGIIAAETGDTSWGGADWQGGGDWQQNQLSQKKQDNSNEGGAEWDGGPDAGAEQTDRPQSPTSWVNKEAGESESYDTFFLAGRPVIEVSSGLEALADLKLMIPLLLVVIAVTLFAVFRTLRGVALPLFVMAASIIWTMGMMAVLNVPLYTISTMLPVILVAVGVGDGIHLLSNYYDNVLRDPHRESRDIVLEVMNDLGPPLITTSLTTAMGFLALWFAEMPPFKIFGLFTVLGILVCWFLSVTFLPAVLCLLRPKVGGYLQKRQSMRVRDEQNRLVKGLVLWGDRVVERKRVFTIGVLILVVVATLGASRLYVDSSWMSDFRDDSDVAVANDLINEKFSGTITLNVVVDGKQDGALKSPELLQAIEALQEHVESLPYVGDTLSVVDYLKSMNKNLHAAAEEFNVLPETHAQIAEYLFLFSISGRPEELDEVADFGYRQANVSVQIKTDRTMQLKTVIDSINEFVETRFAGLDVDVNLAGSGNNSYVWADLLIDSQTSAIVISKLGILILATLLFRSFITGVFVVVPVTLTTLLMGGFSGLFSIPLDVSTVLAAGVAIGVGVDYAVHYIFRYKREFKATADHLHATRAAMRGVGKTIVFNAVVVTAGFSVLFFSFFPPHAKLGNFVAAYMVLSCVIALLILPILFSIGKRNHSASVAQRV